jgi:hypothetical protein
VQGAAGAQGVQGATGPNGVQFWNHVTSGYTSGAKVYVQTAQPTANAAGDIWLQI